MDCTIVVSASWSVPINRRDERAVTSVDDGKVEDPWGSLMRAAQDGDGRAYGQLLSEITPVLRRVVRGRWVGSGAADAEDVVQDALLSLHSVRHTYDPARPFLPWMLAIAQFRIKDAIRKSARRGVHERGESSLEYGLPDIAAEPREEVLGDPQELARALAELPEGQRRAVQMLKLEECSLKEASMATGMTTGALKVAVHRGLKALRAALAGEKQ